jgi:hypothetical protein
LFWGEHPPFTLVRVGGVNFLITKSGVFGSPCESRSLAAHRKLDRRRVYLCMV